MAVKKTQMYRKNLDTSETNLYPLTEAQYVSMENGQTVQEILSDRDSDKYTPVITNSSSTFKVGQGDNVDLSPGMKEGAYDSCVLKGKTMVNCIQEPSSKDVVLPYEFADGRYVTINDTKESGALGIELKGQTLVNISEINRFSISGSGKTLYTTKKLIKDNTTYTRIVYISKNTLTGANERNCVAQLIEGGNTVFSNDIQIALNETGLICNETFNSGTTSSSKKSMSAVRIFTVNTGGVLEGYEIILEGDYTDIDIPYFEGMASCKMPILHTVGKNLLPYNEMFVSPFTSATPYITKNVATFPFTLGVNGRGVGIKFKVEPNTTYTLSSNVVIPNTVVGVAFYKNESDTTNHNNKLGIAFSTNIEESTKTFTTPNECNWIVCGMYILYTYEQSGGTVVISEMPKLQLEKNTQATTHEPHKSSILSLPEEVVLRSLSNGVRDTFNTRTGVYTQMVQEFVFDGSDDEGWMLTDSSASHETMIAFEVKNRDYMNNLNKYDNQPLLNNLFRVYTDKSWNYFDDEHFRQWGDGSSMSWVCVIPRSKLSSVTVEGFKSWLSKNPMKVVAKLKTPIITKVNLSSTLKSWNTTTHIYSEIPENTLYPILSHSNPSYPVILKPSTKYSIVANSYSNDHTNSAIKFNLGGATASTTVGSRVTTITTPSTLSNELLTMGGRGNKLNNVMVIEGDVAGDEPYFEGMCDSKSPILLNCGENLFDKTKVKREKYQNYNVPNGIFSISSNSNYKVTDYIRVKPNTSYTSRNLGDGAYYTFNKKPITDIFCRAGNFTVPSNAHYVVLNMSIGQDEDAVGLQEVPSSSLHEPYKSNTTTFDQKDGKTIVLRSLPSGVCDTLNVETGEYTQRIGEYTYNGDNDVEQHYVSNNNHGQSFFTIEVNSLGRKEAIAGISDTLPHESIYSAVEQTKNAFCVSLGGNTAIRFYIDRLTTTEQYRNHFRNAPITIQYELATPIVTTIDIQGFPYAYTNGHVQLSSGHSGQSLTPKVEYSLSANKTGQIDSNTRQVVRQQKQLDDFEAMMLTSLVESAYDKAILQFDYEMQMMSLGGE